VNWQRYAAEFDAEAARLGAVAAGLEPSAPVPTCPEWTVRDLVGHVGTGHRWSAGVVEGRLQVPPEYVRLPAPDDPGGWEAWLCSGARRLAEAVRAAGPDCPVWTWQPSDRTAGLWLRRMLHDELIHRYDAELTAGLLGEVAPDLAADGVSDLLTTIATLSSPGGPASPFTALAGSDATLCLRATDVDPAVGTWLARRTGDGVRWRHGVAEADVTVEAPARDLLLVLNRRLGPDRPG
jgi:uncharacterized protein (TIGR03083 family)